MTIAPAAFERPSLTPEQFVKFRDFIYVISGIMFPENKNYFLAAKLINRVKALELKGLDEYYLYLKSMEGRAGEYPLLLDEVTINETFFFRNQPQIESFTEKVLKPLIAKRREAGRKRLRIWSCAASTGDEPYTIALIVKTLPEAQDMQIEIVGTDICRQALALANKGEYSQYAVRNIPHDMLQKYFTKNEDGRIFTISDEIKQMVKLKETNLMNVTEINALGRVDIAFCRNVLIYFDEPAKEQVLKNIYNVVENDGYLLVGHSENIYSHRHIFMQDKEKSDAIAHIKAPVGTLPSRV